MIPFFPKRIAKEATWLYVGVLSCVTMVFFTHAMSFIYIALGVMWVVAFFMLSSYFTTKWGSLSEKRFLSQLFGIAVLVRVIWVIFSYFFYKAKTGIPFEFGVGDAIVYHDDAQWMASIPWSTAMWYLFDSGMKSIADTGYPLYLSILYRIIGPNIFLARIIKCLISAATCVLSYKLSKRLFGDSTARLAAIFTMLMPNLIIYCGLHLKETEMLFLIVAYLERADYLLRTKKYNVWTITVPVLLILSMFLFRTVLGAVAALAFLTAVVFTTEKVVGKTKRIMLISWSAVTILVMMGGTIQTEIEGLLADRDSNVAQKRYHQERKGIKWAKYATGTVMAPMALFLPYPTMVDVDNQYNQQIMHAGNYVKNFMGIFVLIAIYTAFFVKKNWRELVFVGSFVVGYLLAVAMSGFSNSERFLLPAVPGLMIMAAYGVSQLNYKNFVFVRYWYIVVALMAVGWSVFKLGSRGIF